MKLFLLMHVFCSLQCILKVLLIVFIDKSTSETQRFQKINVFFNYICKPNLYLKIKLKLQVQARWQDEGLRRVIWEPNPVSGEDWSVRCPNDLCSQDNPLQCISRWQVDHSLTPICHIIFRHTFSALSYIFKEWSLCMGGVVKVEI